MPVIDRIKDFQNDLVAIRRDIHAHPEIGFEETRTSAIVADLLETWGITVHRGVGGTGVVGELRGNHNSNKRIGLRADMDALPILETTGLPYACLLYTSDAADERSSVDLGGRRIIKKKTQYSDVRRHQTT